MLGRQGPVALTMDFVSWSDQLTRFIPDTTPSICHVIYTKYTCCLLYHWLFILSPWVGVDASEMWSQCIYIFCLSCYDPLICCRLMLCCTFMTINMFWFWFWFCFWDTTVINVPFTIRRQQYQKENESYSFLVWVSIFVAIKITCRFALQWIPK